MSTHEITGTVSRSGTTFTVEDGGQTSGVSKTYVDSADAGLQTQIDNLTVGALEAAPVDYIGILTDETTVDLAVQEEVTPVAMSISMLPDSTLLDPVAGLFHTITDGAITSSTDASGFYYSTGTLDTSPAFTTAGIPALVSDGTGTELARRDAIEAGVSQSYVDDQDATTLTAANGYTDTAVSDEQTRAEQAESDLSNLIAAKADLVDGLIPTSQLPALAISDTFTAANQAAMLALTAQRGDLAVRTDNGHRYILTADDPTTLGNWVDLGTSTDAVVSVNGQVGIVVLGYSDVGADAAGAAAAAQAYAVQRANHTGTQSIATITGTVPIAQIPTGSTGSTVPFGNDSRFSDARTPTSHAASHASAGSDPVTLAQSQITNLVSDLAAKVASTDSRIVNGGYPTFVSWEWAFSGSSGSWTVVGNTGGWRGGWVTNNTSPASGNYVEWRNIYVPAGTYTVIPFWTGVASGPTFQMSVDGSNVGSGITTATTANIVGRDASTTGVSISAGLHTVRATISASGNPGTSIRFGGVLFQRTA